MVHCSHPRQPAEKEGQGFTGDSLPPGSVREKHLQAAEKLFCLNHLFSSASGCSQDEPLCSAHPRNPGSVWLIAGAGTQLQRQGKVSSSSCKGGAAQEGWIKGTE